LRTLKRDHQVNVLKTQREHSRKPDELFDIIEAYGPGALLGAVRSAHTQVGPVGDEAAQYSITWSTYSNNSQKTGERPSKRYPVLSRDAKNRGR
jgi:hypothetical protein